MRSRGTGSGHGRAGRARRATTWFLLGAFLGTLPGAPAAIAAPEGERVVHGDASFERDGNSTTITTGTRETIVDYDRFDVGVEESVRIDQPDAGSRILNRVPRGDESRIEGVLSSNGIVYILNPAGVFLGDRAIVDVGGLVAGAGVLANEDFLAGVDRFSEVSGDVGIEAGAQVRSAGDVALVGRHVENLGSIVSEGGLIAIVAGENVLLTRMGGHVAVRVDASAQAPEDADFALIQAGKLEAGKVTLAAGDAYSLAMNHTGVTRAEEIYVQAEGDGIVQIAGTLDASSTVPGEQGGSIRVQGGRIAVQDAMLDASGEAGGGEILVGGDVRGGGELPTARRVYVGPDAVLRADATGAGDGGKIVVFADERTAFYGALSARGGPQGGDGGFAEISGAQLESRGQIDLGAPQGKSGTLLYDPDKIVIQGSQGGVADGSDDPDTSESVVAQSSVGQVLAGDAGGADPFVIHESEIEGTDADIILEAVNRIETSGDFAGDVVVILPGNSLTLRTTGTTAPEGATDAMLGIDLTQSVEGANLAWQLSQGGNITLETSLPSIEFADAPESPPPKASIVVGRLESLGAAFEDFEGVSVQLPVERSISVSAGRGDITIGSILADGENARAAVGEEKGRSASAGANVSIASQQGNVTVASIHAAGGSGLADAFSPGANGGEVAVSSAAGNVSVGEILVPGGDGIGGLFDGDELIAQGFGGAGGAISLTAVRMLDGEGNVQVTGDLIARAGGSRPAVIPAQGDEPEPVQSVPGNIGGAISIIASNGIVVGSAGDPVLLDASGGDGSASGGDARGAFPSLPGLPGEDLLQAISFSGPVSTGTKTTTQGEVVVHGELRARGGKARQAFGSGLEVEGGAGGRGGDVLMNVSTLSARDMTIDVSGGKGDIAPLEATNQPPVASNGLPLLLGGQGGTVSLLSAQGSDVGKVVSRGGDAHNGTAGIGGSVTLEAGDAAGPTGDEVPVPVDLVVGDIDTSGGNASRDAATGVALEGGLGGGIALNAIEKDVGVVFLRGRIRSDRGTGLDAEGGTTRAQPSGSQQQRFVTVEAASAIEMQPDAVAGDVVVSGGALALTAPRIGVLRPIPIAGTGLAAPDGTDLAIVTADERLAVELRDDDGSGDADVDALERVNLVLLDEEGSARVTRGGTDVLRSVAADADSRHTLELFQTQDADPFLSYRLNVELAPPAEGEPQPLQPDLAIERGAVALGTAGGEIVNGGVPLQGQGFATNRGAIVGVDKPGDTTSPHATSRGTLRLEGKTLGEPATPLEFAGDPGGELDALRLDAQGAVEANVTVPFEAIEIVQHDAQASASVELPGADVIDIDPVGGDPLVPGSVVRADTRASGSGFAYRLEAVASGSGANPRLDVENVQLGGTGLLSTRGDIVLKQPMGAAAPIVTNGNALTLSSAAGSIQQESATDASIDMRCTTPPCGETSQLALGADLAIGSAEKPIRTRAVEHLAGRASQGSFVLVNDGTGAGDLHIERLKPLDPVDLDGTPDLAFVQGVSAGSPGSIDLTHTGTRVVLGEITDGAEFSASQLTAAGDVVLHAPAGILIENPRLRELELPVVGTVTLRHNDARISAGGDVVLDGPVSTSDQSSVTIPGTTPTQEFVHASLQIEAGGTARFLGDVGGDGTPAQSDRRLALLDTTDASVEGQRTFRVGDARFRGTLDGAGAGGGATLRVEDLTPSADHVATATFEGDLGARQALMALDVEAEHIRFTTADRIIAGAGGVRLDTNQSVSAIPQFATIADTAGGLGIQTSGAFATGDYDKLTVQGPLSIQAQSVRVTDVNAARRLDIDAPAIEVVARPGAALELQDGSTLPEDRGTDLVADSMAFSSVPTIAQNPAPAGPVTLGLGGGGVSAPGNLSAFEVRRFTADVDSVTPKDMVGANGRILDLMASGQTLVGYPAEDMPRESPVEEPELGPRFTESRPAPAPAVSAEQVLAYLRCGEGASLAACDAGAVESLSALRDWDDSALATQRAAELAARYRAMRSRDLSAAFDAAGAGYREANGFGEFDGPGFGTYLERTREHAEARAALEQLATLLVEVELLGLAPEDETRVRRELASELAFEADLPGFDTDAVLAAVAATPIGLPRAE